MAPSDILFPWTITSIRYIVGECVLPHRLLQGRARQKKMRVYKCEDIWVCRKQRDVSCGHQFCLIDFSEFSHKLM